ncbi:hypothetical protein BC826DRAFT_1110980 [Russula brevipes]|nr:hypothetical protein BC826DRAFT_1110980 [Russula brevipes]
MRTDVQTVLRPARAIPRCVGPFFNIRATFLAGFEISTDVNRDPTLRANLEQEEDAILATYLKILETVPGLDKLAEETAAVSSHALVELAVELDRVGTKGRTDDCGSLRENGLKYIPRRDNRIDIDFGVKKDQRGTPPEKMPGKRTVAELYDIKLTPETIAYAAIMCRHVLNSKESWAVQDGSFQANVFYHNIVDLFEDKDWADETMAWWNKWRLTQE